MATITFKGKIIEPTYVDGTPAPKYIKVPDFKRSHCDMGAFRKHPKYGSYANSDLFPNMLARIKKDLFGQYTQHLMLDKVPNNVQIDTSGFLAQVTIEV